jgi:hypothetical protein
VGKNLKLDIPSRSNPGSQMAISLKSIKKKSAADLQPIFTIYGVPKIGKTSLALEFPRPIVIQTSEGENAPAGVVADTFEVRNWAELCETIGVLALDDHDFATAVFDSTTGLQNIIAAEACARNGWKTLEDPGFGKGPKMAAAIWLEYIDGITTLRRDKQMAIVQLGHTVSSRFDDPVVGPYDRYRINLQKDAAEIIEANSDVIVFVNQKRNIKAVDAGFNKDVRHAEGTGNRWLFLEEKGGFTAGNRFSMPPEIMFKKGEGYKALAKYLPAVPAAADAA